MRRLLLTFLFMMAGPLFAQETYSLPASAGNVADLTAIVDATNGRVCETRGLPVTCTQAQICVAASAPGGASCTAAQARQAQVRIFPQTQAGREEYVAFMIALPKFLELRAEIVKRAQERLQNFWNIANQSQKDALCIASDQPAGCLIYP